MAKLFLLFTLFFALNFPVFAEPAIIEHHRPGVGNYFPIEREAGRPFPQCIYILP